MRFEVRLPTGVVIIAGSPEELRTALQVAGPDGTGGAKSRRRKGTPTPGTKRFAKSIRFLRLLSEHGSVEQGDIAILLDIDRKKGVGALIGAVRRNLRTVGFEPETAFERGSNLAGMVVTKRDGITGAIEALSK
ncbi:MAG: hypothetical protein IH851_05570 [Armatimonadetes bacterium]|nr:hypothetical protein [Armatimonadota bacterium]